MTVVYKSGDVMKRLGLKESVFKKYYLALEKEGYVIQKNSSNHRVFTEDDIQTLEKFIELIKYDGMTLESVAKKIGGMKGHNDITEEKQRYDVMSLITAAIEERDKQHSLMMKEQEQQFAVRMQEVLAQQTERIEKEIEAKFNRLEDPIKRIEEHITSNKSWWQRLWSK